MKQNFEKLFSSRSRSAILLTLFEFTEPVCLNELAELSSSSLCAAAATVCSLTEAGLLQKRKLRNETVYSLNRQSADTSVIHSISKALERNFLMNRAIRYGRKPAEALRFASESGEFLDQVRRRNGKSRRAA